MHNNRYKKASSKIARRRKVRESLVLFFKMLLPLFFLWGLVWFLRTDFLQIKNFQIVGNDTLSAEDLNGFVQNQILGNKLFFIPKSNIVLLNKNNLASALLSRFSRIEKIEIDRQFLDRIVNISVTERKSVFLWCSNDFECFNMTAEGLIFESAENTGDKMVFGGLITGDPLLKNFATPEKMQNYENLIYFFKSDEISISSINIESVDKAVAKSSVGDIIFNPEEKDLVPVVQNALLLINKIKSKSPVAQFLYLDARFGNKIFYKLK